MLESPLIIVVELLCCLQCDLGPGVWRHQQNPPRFRFARPVQKILFTSCSRHRGGYAPTENEFQAFYLLYSGVCILRSSFASVTRKVMHRHLGEFSARPRSACIALSTGRKLGEFLGHEARVAKRLSKCIRTGCIVVNTSPGAESLHG